MQGWIVNSILLFLLHFFFWESLALHIFQFQVPSDLQSCFISLCFFQDRKIEQCQNEILEQKEEIDSLKTQLKESTRIIKSLKQELEQYTEKKGKQENEKKRYFFFVLLV